MCPILNAARQAGKTQIPLCRLSPKLTRGESRGHKSRKSRIQTISTCRDVCDKVRDKPVCVALMEFSLLQCTGKVGNKVGDKVRDKFTTRSRTCHRHKSWKSATWFVSRTFIICVHDKSATLSGTCPGLCRKVSVMEFWFFTYPITVEGWVDLGVGYTPRWFICPQTVSHPFEY